MYQGKTKGHVNQDCNALGFKNMHPCERGGQGNIPPETITRGFQKKKGVGGVTERGTRTACHRRINFLSRIRPQVRTRVDKFPIPELQEKAPDSKWIEEEYLSLCNATPDPINEWSRTALGDYQGEGNLGGGIPLVIRVKGCASKNTPEKMG